MKNINYKIYAILFDTRASDAMKLTRIEALLKDQPFDWHYAIVTGASMLLTFLLGFGIGLDIGSFR